MGDGLFRTRMKLAGQIRSPTCVDADVLAGEDLTEIDLSALEGRKLCPIETEIRT